MSDFSLASLIWVGDSKTNSEGSYGPECKIHARRDSMSDFSLRPYLGSRLQDKLLRPSAPQSSFKSKSGDVDPLPDLSICLTDGMVFFV